MLCAVAICGILHPYVVRFIDNIKYWMPFLDFLFSPQAHKFRGGYNINHDTLINGKLLLRHSVPRSQVQAHLLLHRIASTAEAQ